MRFQLGGASWTLEFTSQAIAVMLANAQTHKGSSESVGQFYTRDLTKSQLVIEHATCLSPQFASRSRVRFDPSRALAERQRFFQQGLHCVGLWHTHPEPYPRPSPEDQHLALNYAVAAQAQLSGIVFVIVGNLPLPNTFHVWVADSDKLHSLKQVTAP